MSPYQWIETGPSDSAIGLMSWKYGMAGPATNETPILGQMRHDVQSGRRRPLPRAGDRTVTVV
ncbi:MAG: hypothetical protein AMXMBFR59_35700 [Rhodanobacteraceae bacterium]